MRTARICSFTNCTRKGTKTTGLQIAPENVQQQPPCKYLGVKILDQTTQPQTIQFSTKIQTLNDAEKLLDMALFSINHPTIRTLV